VSQPSPAQEQHQPPAPTPLNHQPCSPHTRSFRCHCHCHPDLLASHLDWVQSSTPRRPPDCPGTWASEVGILHDQHNLAHALHPRRARSHSLSRSLFLPLPSRSPPAGTIVGLSTRRPFQPNRPSLVPVPPSFRLPPPTASPASRFDFVSRPSRAVGSADAEAAYRFCSSPSSLTLGQHKGPRPFVPADWATPGSSSTASRLEHSRPSTLLRGRYGPLFGLGAPVSTFDAAARRPTRRPGGVEFIHPRPRSSRLSTSPNSISHELRP